MTPHYADDWLTVYHGDSRAVMAEMEPESVHCVVTSPPYWGLRDYGTATWMGGSADCDHKAPSRFDYPLNPGLGPTGVQTQASNAASDQRAQFRGVCGKCGAARIDSQLGLEPTLEAYVEAIVAVFRAVRRVLRSDGTVWLNLGDSYLGKQLAGIPWRVALALQEDDWYLRSDIIWAKPNPMPESVTDRPTKSHEYLFLLSKSSRYYFDADAVREPHTSEGPRRDNGLTDGYVDLGMYSGRAGNPEGGRNIRSVWTIATAPYPGAHFATFPPKLVEPCIKAGTSERGVCPECGAPWVREVERTGSGRDYERGSLPSDARALGQPQRSGAGSGALSVSVTTTGWRPSCRCEHDGGGWVPTPATVLDPFAGSGTTGMVAQSLSRRAVLIDLSMDYLDQLMDRNRDIPLGLGV